MTRAVGVCLCAILLVAAPSAAQVAPDLTDLDLDGEPGVVGLRETRGDTRRWEFVSGVGLVEALPHHGERQSGFGILGAGYYAASRRVGLGIQYLRESMGPHGVSCDDRVCSYPDNGLVALWAGDGSSSDRRTVRRF